MTRPELALPHLIRHGLDLNPDFTTAADEHHGIVGLPGPAGRTTWIVSRYRDVREVLVDHERFSNADVRLGGPDDPRDDTTRDDATDPPAATGDTRRAPGSVTETEAPQGPPPPDLHSGSLLATDPPEHTRLRRMLSAEFTVKRIRWVEPRISSIVERCVTHLQASGPPAEFVSAFALPVPSLVICELLGVPYADRERFQRRSTLSASKTLTGSERAELARESHEYMGTLVDHATRNPGEDILGMLIREHGDDLTRTELINMADLLLFAGHETTANMLGVGTLALLQHPDQLARLRDNPELIGPAIEELLRYLSVLQMSIPRTATRDTEIAGQAVARGDLVMVSLSAANRDPDFVTEPEVLDISRQPTPHLAFGYGIHHCLGAQLARAEMRIAWPALLERFPALALDPDHPVEYRPADVFFGVASLPVMW